MVVNYFFSKFDSDFLFADEVEIPCRVGVSREERAFPQIIKISFHMFLSLQKAGRTHRLKDTVDYASVISEIKKNISRKKYLLIESIGEDVAAIILRNEKIRGVKVLVSKKIFAGINSVGVSVTRTAAKNKRQPHRD